MAVPNCDCCTGAAFAVEIFLLKWAKWQAQLGRTVVTPRSCNFNSGTLASGKTKAAPKTSKFSTARWLARQRTRKICHWLSNVVWVSDKIRYDQSCVERVVMPATTSTRATLGDAASQDQNFDSGRGLPWGTRTRSCGISSGWHYCSQALWCRLLFWNTGMGYAAVASGKWSVQSSLQQGYAILAACPMSIERCNFHPLLLPRMWTFQWITSASLIFEEYLDCFHFFVHTTYNCGSGSLDAPFLLCFVSSCTS